MKHVLVTGAAGFIGSHLVDALLADDVTVTGIDNFDPFYDEQIKQDNVSAHRTEPRFSLARADIRDFEALVTAASGSYDAIVHLAARAGVRPSIADPVGYQQVNVIGTQNVLELARLRRIPHVVFASSSSVYGINPVVPWREDDHVLQPISPYASTKVSGELLGHVYAHLFGIRFVALRFFTVYGPRQRPEMAIHKFVRLALAGQPLPFFGDGTTRRDYTYVDDIVDGVVRSIDRCAGYEIYNLGESQTTSLAELVRLIGEVCGVEPVLDRRPMQPGDVLVTFADVSKARAELGYAPSTAVEVGLRRFVDWYRERML
jgi:UDP-glucuronate 4-epimerase